LKVIEVNFARAPRQPSDPWLGSFIRFDLVLPEEPVLLPGIPAASVSVHFLDGDERPGFRTEDPLGTDALLALEAVGGTPGWELSAFAPARLTRGTPGTADTVSIMFPRRPHDWLPPVRPPLGEPQLGFYRNKGNRMVTIKFGVPHFGGGVRLGICDSAGRMVRVLGEWQELEGGPFSVDWPERDDGGQPVPLGRYTARLDIGRKTITKTLVLD
jgi:hypothetical protein